MVQNSSSARKLDTGYQNSPQKTVRKKVKRSHVLKRDNLKVFALKLGIVSFAFALLLVFLCTRTATLGYQIVHLEEEISQLEEANKRLEYEIAEKSSLSWVEQVASNELGMKKAVDYYLCANMTSTTSVDKQVEESDPQTSDIPSNKTLEKISTGLMDLVARINN